jgi:hypothetical protein
MGGSVSITLRLADGAEYRMLRSTNIMPFYLTNAQFYNEDPAFIERFLKGWNEMVFDYEQHKEDGQYEFNMTRSYTEFCHGLVPDEYGLVVVDCVNHVILSSQYYTTIGVINTVGFRQEVKYQGLDSEDDSDIKRFCDLWDDGRVIRVDARPSIYAEVRESFRKKDYRDYKNVDWLNGKTSAEVMEIIDPLTGLWEYTFYFDPRPFVIEDFREGKRLMDSETGEDWSQLHDRVLELGFVLTPEEEVIWAGRISGERDAPLTVFNERVRD